MFNFHEFFYMTEVNFSGSFDNYFGPKNILDGHTLVVLDSETTGLDKRIPHVQILSISAASFNTDNETMGEVFNQFADLTPETQNRRDLDQRLKVDTDQPSYRYIDDFLKKSKWNETEKSGSEIQVVQNFVDFVNKFENVLLCGYNIGFDLRMINTCLKKHGRKPLSYPAIDVMRFVNVFLDPAIENLASQGIIAAKEMISSVTNSANKKSYTLQNVASILNVLIADGHVSLADIEMTGKVLTQSIKFIKNYQDKFDNNYTNFERKSRKAYRDKLNWFYNIRNQNNNDYKTKQRFMDMVEKDVHNGVLQYIKHLESKAQKERESNKKYSKLRDIQLKIIGIKNLLNSYAGNSSEILKFIYNS